MAEEETKDWRDPNRAGSFNPNKPPNARELLLAMSGYDTLEELYSLPTEQWTKLTPIVSKLRYGDRGEAMSGEQWGQFLDDPENMKKLKEAGAAALKPGVTVGQGSRLGQALTGLLPAGSAPGVGDGPGPTGDEPAVDERPTIGGAKVSEAKLRRRRSLLGG